MSGEIITIVDSGSCGKSLNWKFLSDGRLVINGTGQMSISGQPWSQYLNAITTIEIEEGCTQVSTGAFSNIVNANDIIVPASLIAFGGASPFNNNVNLQNIYYAGTPSQWTKIGGVRFVTSSTNTNSKNYYFAGDLLSDIVLDDDIIDIPASSFYKAIQIESINLDNVVTIGGSAFLGCTSLTSVDVHNATTIGLNAFQNCNNLTGVINLDSLVDASNYIFENCNLLGVYFGENITYAGYRSFTGNSNCEFYDFSKVSAIPRIGSTNFSGIKNYEIRVPSDLYDEWLTTTVQSWSFYRGANYVSVE